MSALTVETHRLEGDPRGEWFAAFDVPDLHAVRGLWGIGSDRTSAVDDLVECLKDWWDLNTELDRPVPDFIDWTFTAAPTEGAGNMRIDLDALERAATENAPEIQYVESSVPSLQPSVTVNGAFVSNRVLAALVAVVRAGQAADLKCKVYGDQDLTCIEYAADSHEAGTEPEPLCDMCAIYATLEPFSKEDAP